MKLSFFFITSILFCLISVNAMADSLNLKKVVVRQIERPGRPPLLTKSKALYPFTMLTSRLGSYTVYEPADKLTLFADGSVSYVRLDELGEVAFRGHLSAEDMLVKLPNQIRGQYRRGQKVCLARDTFYLPAGTALNIKDFYEENYVTLYAPGLFRALDSRSFAVHLYDVKSCR